MALAGSASRLLFDLSPRIKLRVTGADRVRFLNGQITNDIRKATESATVEACVLNAKGKLEAHLFVHQDGESFVIDANPALQPVLQPRFAMSMAMTILSLAMVERCTGIHTQQISAADLNPAVLWNGLEEKAYRTWDRTVKYYENLRLVYEVETALREIREQQDTAPASQSPTQKDSKTGDRQPETESSPK